MAKDKFCFVQTSPFGQSKEAQRLEQLRARAHAASVSPRRTRTSFQIIHDVLHVPTPQLDIPATAYGLPFSPQSPSDQSPDTTHQLSSTGAICASSSAEPLSSPETPEASEEQDITNEGQAETVEVRHSKAFRRPVAGDLVTRNRGAGLIPSDYRCFRGMRTDPFDCVPTRGSESVSGVVDYRAFQHHKRSHCWKHPNQPPSTRCTNNGSEPPPPPKPMPYSMSLMSTLPITLSYCNMRISCTRVSPVLKQS
jgi:hypothetical protein